ncbi:unnamed protein product [Aureobasidium uvarum]|uniref:Cryptic loci regulator 2 N-terminal domain-containing protein n=1 Tax=Aureobasidium uvarum TaxID=2773716 RepID=A0A9N8PUG0_9PEZI|nr:unnamed protein product [Aureobasidium uvarum]
MTNQPSTQGPVVGRVPNINDNLPLVSTDLSIITSDGTGRYPTHMTRPDHQHVLDYLTQIFNLSDLGQGVYNISFTGALPQGYAAFSYRSSSGHALIEIWGHPSGRPFATLQNFSIHALSIMTSNLVSCRCPLCNLYRPASARSPCTDSADTPDMAPKDSPNTA